MPDPNYLCVRLAQELTFYIYGFKEFSLYILTELEDRRARQTFRVWDRPISFCVASLSLAQLTSRSRFASLMISLRRSFSRFRSLILLRMCLRSGFEMCNEQ